MTADMELGAVLRELRRARGMTLKTVAKQAGCAESLISCVESGSRRLLPWLAARLDTIYRTGGVITSLGRTVGKTAPQAGPGAVHVDLVMVEPPGGGDPVPLSRRDLLAALGVGLADGVLRARLDSVIDSIGSTGEALATYERAHVGYQSAARMLAPTRLVDGLIGDIAIIDGLRRRVAAHDRPRWWRTQARYAETLSWLSEEAGDLAGAMYWIDRAAAWGQAADWPAMAAYGFVRRSMMVVSFGGDGPAVVDHAQAVLAMSSVSPRLQGLAAKQAAYGHALAGDATASARALDQAARLLSAPAHEDDAVLGQRSVITDDLLALFRATCDIYLGRGDQAVRVLDPMLGALSTASLRTATITRAKLARAYAHAGQPAEAARLSLAALDDSTRVGSRSARGELVRALPMLHMWRRRDDVGEVLRRLSPTG